MNKLQMVKGTLGLVVSVGAGTIVGNIVSATLPGNMGILKKGCVVVTTMVAANCVSDTLFDYTNAKIDEVVNSVKDVINYKSGK